MDINSTASQQELTASSTGETESLLVKNSSNTTITTRSLSARINGGWRKGPTLAEIVFIPLVITLVLGMMSLPLFAHFIPVSRV